MRKSAHILRDCRRSKKYIHVGKVTVYPRAASWHIYCRENGTPRRIRIGPDRKAAERRAAEVNAQLAHGTPSCYGFERISVEEVVCLWLEHHELVLRSSVATVRRYRAAIDHLLRFAREKHPGLTADLISPQTAQSFVKHLRSTCYANRFFATGTSALPNASNSADGGALFDWRHARGHVLAPGVEQGAQFVGLFRLGEGEIVLFARVGFQVEQLHGAVFKIFQQFVIALADRAAGALHAVIAVVREVPVDRLSPERFALDRGGEAHAVHVLSG